MKKNNNILITGKGVINSEINALKKLKKSIGKSFIEAVELIYNTIGKGNIIFTGVGKSKLILEKTCGTFSSLGVATYTLDPMAANHGDLGRLQQKDIIIIASNSGNSTELDAIIKFSKNNNIKIIGITSNNKSKLFKNSNIKITYPKVKEAGNKNFTLVPTSSTTILAAIGDALAICTAEKKKFKISNFGENHPHGYIGKSLTKIKELLIPITKLPFVDLNASFSKTLQVIAKKKLGCALIKNKNQISLVTDGDTARAANKYKNIQKLRVKDFMTKKPLIIDENTLVPDTLNILNEKKINVVLIKRKEKFVGLVNLHKIIEFLGK